MRLYVNCHNRECKDRIYLQFSAQSKTQIPELFRVKCSNPQCKLSDVYRRGEVKAEANTNAGLGGMIAGGAVGLLGGPIGLILGAMIGGAAGAEADRAEQERVRRFNEG